MNGTLARAREALSVRDFRFLFASRLTSQLGDGLFQALLAVSVVFVPEEQSTTVGFAQVVAILLVPFSLIGPLTGVFIDRWSRRRILVLTPLLRAGAVLLTVGGVSPAAPFYLGALVAVSANRFFLSTAGAVMPRLVPPTDLLVGNSVATVGGTVATFLGVTIGGPLADLVGPGPLVYLTAGAWLLSSAAAARIRSDLTAERPSPTPLRHHLARVVAELHDGVRRLWSTRGALAPITSIGLDQFFQGLILVIALVIFRERFEQGVASFSRIVAAGGAGILVGLATVGALESRWTKPAIVTVAFAVSGLALVAAAPALTALSVLVASFFLGLSFAWKKIPIDTMVQEAIPDAFRGRVFAVYDVVYNMVRVLAALLAIFLIPAIGVGAAVALSGVVFLLWVPVLPVWIRRPRRIAVRFYAGGRADELPRSVILGGAEEAVEVVRSWREDRAGVRLVCFRLRLARGSVIDVSRPEAGGGWRIDRELSA